METLSRFYIPIIGFVVTAAFGFWVSKVGRPYNGLLFNIHKLIALGAVIITSMKVFETLKTAPAQVLFIGLVVIAGMAVVALFVSGAFLSIGNVKYEVVKLIHNVAFALVILALGTTIYLFSGIT